MKKRLEHMELVLADVRGAIKRLMARDNSTDEDIVHRLKQTEAQILVRIHDLKEAVATEQKQEAERAEAKRKADEEAANIANAKGNEESGDLKPPGESADAVPPGGKPPKGGKAAAAPAPAE